MSNSADTHACAPHSLLMLRAIRDPMAPHPKMPILTFDFPRFINANDDIIDESRFSEENCHCDQYMPLQPVDRLEGAKIHTRDVLNFSAGPGCDPFLDHP